MKTAELAGRLVPIGNDNGKREALLKRLRAVSPNEALIKAVAQGVAFHTSGETPCLVFLLPCTAFSTLNETERLFLKDKKEYFFGCVVIEDCGMQI